MISLGRTLAAGGLGAVILDRIWTAKAPIQPRLYRASPRLGWTLTPNLDRPIDLVRAGEVIWRTRLRTNRFGFNDRDWTDRRAGVRRVLVIGDSIVESRQVDRELNFVARAEAILTERSGDRHELLNAGVAGWSADSALNFFREIGRGLRPDAVVLALFAGNDLVEGDYDTFRYLFAYSWDCRRYDKPAYKLEDGILRRSNFPAWRNVRARLFSDELYKRSRSFRAAYQRFNRMMEPRRNGSTILRSQGVTYNMFMDRTKGREHFYSQTVAQVEALREECVSGGASFGVMLEPNFPLFYPADPGASEDSLREYHVDLDHYTELRRRMGGLPLLSLLEPLHAAAEPITFRPADPHLNEAGHRLVGAQLADLMAAV